MPFSASPRQEFDNADSFAQAFDTAWKSLYCEHSDRQLSTPEKLEAVLQQVHEHPFMISSPSLARAVGEFRIRLLHL